MSYIKKTLTDDEKIIIFQRTHWIFWFWPGAFVLIPLIGFLFLWPEVCLWILPIDLLLLLFFYLKYISTENVTTSKRIILKIGFIRLNTDELRNEKIENIQIEQSIIGKILGYGNLEFRGVGGSPVIFKLISNPISMKKKIENIIYKS